jgi:hypothetical protein
MADDGEVGRPAAVMSSRGVIFRFFFYFLEIFRIFFKDWHVGPSLWASLDMPRQPYMWDLMVRNAVNLLQICDLSNLKKLS